MQEGENKSTCHVATELFMAFSVAAFVHQPMTYLWTTPWHFRQLDSWGPFGDLWETIKE